MRKISLKLDPGSDLKWKEEEREALQTDENLLWELHLGLPFKSEVDVLSIQLGLRHFRDHFYPQFASRTKGILLYKGLLFPKEQFDYLLDLLPELPDEQEVNLDFECSSLDMMKFLSWEGSEHFQVKPLYPENEIALCLPGLEEGWETVERMILPYRPIPERLLTQSWEGVEYLVVVSKGVSSQGLRKLFGFAAAGGKVVTIGQRLGIEGEIPYRDFGQPISI